MGFMNGQTSIRRGRRFRPSAEGAPFTAVPVAQRPLAAFTLMELLVTIGIIGVLATLGVPSFSRARAMATTLRCSSQFRQLAVAYALYAHDHGDQLAANRDGAGLKLGETWVEGWLGLPGADRTNQHLLKQNLLAGYVPDLRVWRCPATRPSRTDDPMTAILRTVSINGFLGSPVDSPTVKTFRQFSSLSGANPSAVFSFIDEREDTLNDGAFSQQWDFDVNMPFHWQIRDKPGTRHRGGAVLAFMDGHVETHTWVRGQEVFGRDDEPAPKNQNVLWLQTHATLRD